MQIYVEQACGMHCSYVDVGRNPLPVLHVFGPFLLEPNGLFRDYLEEAGIAFAPEELDVSAAEPELVYRFLRRWGEIYEQPEAAAQIRRYTIYHVVESLHEFFNDGPLEDYEYEDLYLELKDARKENKKLRAQVKKAQARAAALKEEKAELEKRAEKSEAEVRGIRESKSWKLTAPLRKLGHGGK